MLDSQRKQMLVGQVCMYSGYLSCPLWQVSSSLFMDGQLLIWIVLVEREPATQHGRWQCQILVFSGHDMKYCFCQSNHLLWTWSWETRTKTHYMSVQLSRKDKPLRYRGIKEPCSVFSIASGGTVIQGALCSVAITQQSPHWTSVADFDCGCISCPPSLVPAQFSRHISLAFLEFLWVMWYHSNKFNFLFRYA